MRRRIQCVCVRRRINTSTRCVESSLPSSCDAWSRFVDHLEAASQCDLACAVGAVVVNYNSFNPCDELRSDRDKRTEKQLLFIVCRQDITEVRMLRCRVGIEPAAHLGAPIGEFFLGMPAA